MEFELGMLNIYIYIYINIYLNKMYQDYTTSLELLTFLIKY